MVHWTIHPDLPSEAEALMHAAHQADADSEVLDARLEAFLERTVQWLDGVPEETRREAYGNLVRRGDHDPIISALLTEISPGRVDPG